MEDKQGAEKFDTISRMKRSEDVTIWACVHLPNNSNNDPADTMLLGRGKCLQQLLFGLLLPESYHQI